MRARKTIDKYGKRILAMLMAVVLLAVSYTGGMTVEASGRTVSIVSCQISGGNVVMRMQSSGVPGSDDGKFYIFADEVYQDGPR